MTILRRAHLSVVAFSIQHPSRTGNTECTPYNCARRCPCYYYHILFALITLLTFQQVFACIGCPAINSIHCLLLFRIPLPLFFFSPHSGSLFELIFGVVESCVVHFRFTSTFNGFILCERCRQRMCAARTHGKRQCIMRNEKELHNSTGDSSSSRRDQILQGHKNRNENIQNISIANSVAHKNRYTVHTEATENCKIRTMWQRESRIIIIIIIANGFTTACH